MNYPVKSTDLTPDLATDDEQATLIVVEAIMNGTFIDVEFVDEAQRETLLEKVRNWSEFEHYSEVVSSQKTLLNSPFKPNQDRSGSSETEESIVIDSQLIAAKAAQKFTTDKRIKSRRNLFSVVAAAAVVAFIFIGVSSTLSEQNSGTKSNAVRSSSNSESQSPESSIVPDSPTDGQVETGLDESIAGTNSDSLKHSEESVISNRSNKVPPTNQTPDSASKSSSEQVSDTISALQIISAFAIAAVLFAAATTFLRRRKNSAGK